VENILRQQIIGRLYIVRNAPKNFARKEKDQSSYSRKEKLAIANFVCSETN